MEILRTRLGRVLTIGTARNDVMKGKDDAFKAWAEGTSVRLYSHRNLWNILYRGKFESK